MRTNVALRASGPYVPRGDRASARLAGNGGEVVSLFKNPWKRRHHNANTPSPSEFATEGRQ